MKCQSCGYDIQSETANFCFKCGTKLSKTESVVEEAPSKKGEGEKQTEEQVSLETVESLNVEETVLTTIGKLPFTDEKYTGADKEEEKLKVEHLEVIQEIEEEEPLVFEFNTMVEEEEEVEENPLALGLPKWDIVPPNTVVRRKRSI
ncbi:hypothetical protein [Enterococcus sp. AZ109]|uniref:hypothetical protein n=1 Tax=Enterococcus sp. AZ109 TaxID=2774634 RepID=UPI003F1F3633